ncbi:MAG: alpha/beta hydrolase [Hyphomicrobiales bacterium]
MPIDPHAKRFLDMLTVAGPKDASLETISRRREGYAKLMGLSTAEGATCDLEDRIIPGPAGRLTLRIYAPRGRSGERLPGLVYFHGGGLVAGSLADYDGLCGMLANEIGCRLVSVDYRLAPEHRFPAAVLDSYAATRWVVQQAKELGIDRERIAVGGDSAGGTLAAVICQMAKQERGPKLALQLLLCPVMDHDPQTPSRRDFAEGYLLGRATMQRDLRNYCPPGIDPADPRISPLRATHFDGLPAAHIHTAEFDPLRDEGKEYADRLALAGVKVSHTCHSGMIHHFYGLPGIIPYGRRASRLIGAEIRAALA